MGTSATGHVWNQRPGCSMPSPTRADSLPHLAPTDLQLRWTPHHIECAGETKLGRKQTREEVTGVVSLRVSAACPTGLAVGQEVTHGLRGLAGQAGRTLPSTAVCAQSDMGAVASVHPPSSSRTLLPWRPVRHGPSLWPRRRGEVSAIVWREALGAGLPVHQPVFWGLHLPPCFLPGTDV